MPAIRLFLAALAATLAACAPAPQRAAIPTEWRGSPNFDERRPHFVVLHYTAEDDAERALAILSDPLRAVSAHYLVARDGTIHQLVGERERAWHAGESRWGAISDLNSASIGIELDNDGTAPFAPAQVAALLRLLRDVVDRNRIPAANVLGHSDVAPRRKVDPGPAFPWGTLAQHGFGLWCEPPYTRAPEAFDAVAGLRAIGYDVADPGAAIRAFRLHFAPGGSTGELAPGERALILCLSERAMSR